MCRAAGRVTGVNLYMILQGAESDSRATCALLGCHGEQLCMERVMHAWHSQLAEQ